MAEELIKSRVITRLIQDEMKSSYLDYSMSVIVGRALPDARDGLKPVHRRVLFGMHEMSLAHNKPPKKSARIVGEVMGKYHPHGNLPVYDSLVRMAQPWSLRYLLVQGQGNFGSIDGDSPAADRYTEARLTILAEEMLQDLDKNTVRFQPNFDNSLKEPVVLPSKLPNLLINGSTGIAVGMATNIPPHNLAETCAAVIHMIEYPDASVEQLFQHIPGPDFPTGGIICGVNGIKEAYTTGRGKIIVRGKTETEEHKGRIRIIITEVPYMVNKALLVEQIADLVRDKVVQGLTDIRDESDRDGIRVVLETRQGANTDVILNQLYAHSRLQETCGMILLALINNQPRTCTLKDLIVTFLHHRQVVVRKRAEYDLLQAQERAHILEGLLIALGNLDLVIALIKQAKNPEVARQGLMSTYALSEVQAQAILDLKLQRLTALEQDKIHQEHTNLQSLIAELQIILSSEEKILGIIKQELITLKEKYGDKRRTLITTGGTDVTDESLIKPEEVVVTMTSAGYVKRLPLDTYKAQRRGGKGIVGTETKETDVVDELFVANTHNHLLCFTSTGRVHWLKVHQIPESGRYAKGTSLKNLLEIGEERITTLIPVKEFTQGTYLFMVTARGVVKKTGLDEFQNSRKGGIIALGIEAGDELVNVLHTNGTQQVILATVNGLAVKFSESDVRAMGRTAYGVTGIRLKEGDRVISAAIAHDSQCFLTITANGYGKRSPMADYRLISRGGIGVINIKITDKNGPVVTARAVEEKHDVVLISQVGIVIRIPIHQISEVGRNTQGVRIMRLDSTDKVVASAIVPEDNDS